MQTAVENPRVQYLLDEPPKIFYNGDVISYLILPWKIPGYYFDWSFYRRIPLKEETLDSLRTKEKGFTTKWKLPTVQKLYHL